jgi:hypothetical protein
MITEISTGSIDIALTEFGYKSFVAEVLE